MTKAYDVAVIGEWHLAFVTAGVLSSVGHKTLLVNTSEKAWTDFPPLPVHEPGLKEMMDKARKEGLLDFANGLDAWQAPKIWMAIDTPVDDQDRADTTSLWEIARKVSQKKPEYFILNSQIPLGFCAALEKEFSLPVVYIPENLRLGQGIETFFRADRTVIGASIPQRAQDICDFMKKFETSFLTCNLQTAEMVKHANNAFLAMSISFINELARVGEKYNVDSNIVGKALKLDKRIGAKAYVMPGLGFAGGTLPRDLRTLQKLGKESSTPVRIMDAVLSVNADTTQAIFEAVQARVRGKTKPHLLVLGYTYKADTDTLRRSQSLELAELCKKVGFQISGFDPFMNGKDLTQLKGLIEHYDSLEQLKSCPDLILVLTARGSFKEIPWQSLKQQWKFAEAPLVFDTQAVISREQVLEAGFDFKKIWSPLEKAVQA